MTKIITNSGLWFDFADPKPDQVCLNDIAHSLSRVCRYGGHTNEHYSVAQHSVLTAKRLQSLGYGQFTQMGGLMHDGHEAYIGDVVSPLKQFLPEIKEMEYAIDQIIWQALDIEYLAEADWDAIKAADQYMYRQERLYVARPDGMALSNLVAGPTITNWGATFSKHEFMSMFYLLQTQIKAAL